MLYIFFYFFGGNICFSLFNTPTVLEHIFEVISVCFLHFKFVSRVRPRKLNSLTCVMFVLLIGSVGAFTFYLAIGKAIYLDMFMFSDSLLISGRP